MSGEKPRRYDRIGLSFAVYDHSWTRLRKQRLRHMLAIGYTYAEAGACLNVTAETARVAARRYGFVDGKGRSPAS